MPRAQAGDTGARNRLIEGNLGLLCRFAGRLGDDALQECALALLLSVQNFDGRRGVRLFQYAKPAMRRSITSLRFLIDRPVSIPHTAGYAALRAHGTGQRAQPAVRAATAAFASRRVKVRDDMRTTEPEDCEDTKTLLARLPAAIAALPAAEAAVCRGLAGGQTQVQIAAELGISVKVCRRLKAQAFGRLRSSLSSVYCLPST